jgi:hypothetical protein
MGAEQLPLDIGSTVGGVLSASPRLGRCARQGPRRWRRPLRPQTRYPLARSHGLGLVMRAGLSSDVLYVTNGEANDFLHKRGGALAWTPELSPGCPTCGFVFPDDEALVQEEFERNLPFAESVANSAADPDDPKSSLGIKTKPFYIRSDDPYKRGIPGANFAFQYSYGDPQPVQVLAKRALGAVTVKYKINGGATQSAPTSEWTGGERYKPASVYYRVMRGTVTGTKPGDAVEVWFEGGGQTSESFT